MQDINSGVNLLLGKFVKIVYQEPGMEKPHTLYGTLIDICNGLIVFESSQGLGSFNIQYVIAIKPTGRCQ